MERIWLDDSVCARSFSTYDIRLPWRRDAVEQTIGGESLLLQMPAQQFAQDLVPLCDVRGYVNPSFPSDAPTPTAACGRYASSGTVPTGLNPSLHMQSAHTSDATLDWSA